MEALKMNNRRTSAGESFSFPSTPSTDQDSEFEFGSITPDSPATCKSSPADHLFYNGRLMPHSFPVQPSNTTTINTNMRLSFSSRTSSISSSKDSLFSSRSNSINSSRSSSCGSARTSLSSDTTPERKLLYQRKYQHGFNSNNNNGKSSYMSAQVYGSSQKWQIITPVPASSRESSRRMKRAQVGNGGKNNEESRIPKKQAFVKKAAFGRKFLMWFLSVCRECHAMEPSRKDDLLAKKAVIIR